VSTVSNRLTVLVVDDDAPVRELLAQALEREGYAAQEAADGETAQAMFEAGPPAVVILDVNLPKLDGFQLLGRLKRASDVPIILLTGRAEETDRILGLDLGADDYVVKPFSPREVVARVRAVLRRAPPVPLTGRLEFPDLVIDLRERQVIVEGQPVALTRREFDLLAFLASSPRQVFTREQILDQVWSSKPEWQSPTTVTEHVRRLRLQLETDPEHPRHLVSVRGVGYRFQP
jgi:two-component system, OmpR family, phosphate regulon response regulator PhoB